MAETLAPTLDEGKLDAAVDWIDARFPGNPPASVRRAVALVYRAVRVLVDKPFHGRKPEPTGFQLPYEAIAKKTRDLCSSIRASVYSSPTGPLVIDQAEIQACVDALVAAGAFVLVAPGNPIAKMPRARAPVLSLFPRSPEAGTS